MPKITPVLTDLPTHAHPPDGWMELYTGDALSKLLKDNLCRFLGVPRVVTIKGDERINGIRPLSAIDP
jgi:hypothetical protein